jgi:uncharacterized MAPEG superfamily protein
VNVPFACLFIAFLLLYLPKAVLVVAMARAPGGYDNRNPRDQQAKLEGWGRRAVAAQANGFESFAPFAAGVLVAHASSANPRATSILAIVHVAARTLYPGLYIANVHQLRTVVWAIGAGATAGLYVIALGGFFG